jgi:uncharacterized membrane protein
VEGWFGWANEENEEKARRRRQIKNKKKNIRSRKVKDLHKLSIAAFLALLSSSIVFLFAILIFASV